MTSTIYPEDVLINYVGRRLDRDKKTSVYKKFIKQFPSSITYSEEFLPKWSKLVNSSTQAYIGLLFQNKVFSINKGEKIFSYTVYNKEFWEDLDFNFTHRGADRLYETMLKDWQNAVEDLAHEYLIATASDALFISICVNDFYLYTFPWLVANKANWFIIACFIENTTKNHFDFTKCKYLLEHPETCEFPLRIFLIEKLADYLTYIEDRIKNLRVYDFVFAREAGEMYTHLKKALDYWINKVPIGFEDERYLLGAMTQNRVEELYMGVKHQQTLLENKQYDRQNIISEIME
jgi:hypothetical protein